MGVQVDRRRRPRRNEGGKLRLIRIEFVARFGADFPSQLRRASGDSLAGCTSV